MLISIPSCVEAVPMIGSICFSNWSHINIFTVLLLSHALSWLYYANLGNLAFLNTLPPTKDRFSFLTTVVSLSHSQQRWFLQTMQGGRTKPVWLPRYVHFWVNYGWLHSNMQRSLLKEEHPCFLLQQNINRFCLYFSLKKRQAEVFILIQWQTSSKILVGLRQSRLT